MNYSELFLTVTKLIHRRHGGLILVPPCACLVWSVMVTAFAMPAVFAQNNLPSPDQQKIEAFLPKFLKDNVKAGWKKQDRHLSGLKVTGTEYSVHGYIEVYYSKGVDAWITGVPSKVHGGPAIGSVIVALEYDAQNGGTLRRASTMVRQNAADGPADGWFWSSTAFKAGVINAAQSKGSFGAGACFACHGSAGNDGLVFLDGKNGPFPPIACWTGPDAELKIPSPAPPQPANRLLKPRATADPKFLKYFDLKDVTEAVPFPAKVNDHVWAGNYAGKDKKSTERFITSDQCMGCHNAAQLLSNSSPNMWYAEPDPSHNLLPNNPDKKARRNFSPYGEWSASINALSGRDPAWHAQVDFERKLRPKLADFTTSTCFSCHGAMATRQLQTDLGDPNAFFTIDMYYATGDQPSAKYGALARDGVSCAVCHQIQNYDNSLGKDPCFTPWIPKGQTKPTSGYFLPSIAGLNSYTALFTAEPQKDMAAYWGPYKDDGTVDADFKDRILSAAMDRTLGQRAKFADHIKESKLCGACHTVLVPALPVGYELPAGLSSPFYDKVKMSFEQTTYFEWRNSAFENEVNKTNPKAITCQGCHMSSHTPASRIVNAESDRFPPVQGRIEGQNNFSKHEPYYRHVLSGINYFVFEMYEQFPDLLGAKLKDDRVPQQTVDSTVNTRDWIENHVRQATAETRITKVEETGGNLEVTVQVTNHAGHKFPTGAGFRRAFIDFEVLDANGKALWWSGKPNSLGVIVGADNKPLKSEETTVPECSQPHHKVITRQDQAQIYETRALNSKQELQTTVLGIYYEYKDNRIVPLGFNPDETESQTQKATWPVLVGTPDGSTPGKGVNPEATVHPTVLDDGQRPYKVVYDPDYWLPESAAKGQDNIVYKVPLSSIRGWKSVQAQLYYQTIPPYYLRDRFQTALQEKQRFPKERDMNRLIHVASRLNLSQTPADGWSLKVGAPAPGAMGLTQPPLTPKEAWEKLKQHYKYLDLK